MFVVWDDDEDEEVEDYCSCQQFVADGDGVVNVSVDAEIAELRKIAGLK